MGWWVGFKTLVFRGLQTNAGKREITQIARDTRPLRGKSTLASLCSSLSPQHNKAQKEPLHSAPDSALLKARPLHKSRKAEPQIGYLRDGGLAELYSRSGFVPSAATLPSPILSAFAGADGSTTVAFSACPSDMQPDMVSCV